MYKMKADGVLFYDQASNDMSFQVTNPKAKYELNKSGSLTFSLTPGNVACNTMQKLKTVITLERGNDVIFRGRVLETTTNLYNQKEVYCEGELSYLLDSMSKPLDFDGTAVEFLTYLVNSHNEQVEEDKRFTLGLTTAVDGEDRVKAKSCEYVPTLDEIKGTLIGEFNGYLRVRWDNGVRYLDYVDMFNQPCTQEINFGLNLVDISDKRDAKELFTVLIPLGKMAGGKYTTIKDVNDGSDCIEDAEAIAQYGRIVKTHKWDDVDDPETLLALGQAHMEKIREETTLNITAVDLTAMGLDVDSIHMGDTVKIVSAPHGLNREEVCTAIDLDIEYPEKSRYTFGLPLETLTDNYAEVNRKAAADSGHLHRWLTETEDSFDVEVDALNSKINLKADTILLDGYVKADELDAKLADFDFSGIESLDATSASIQNLDVTSLTCDSGTVNLEFVGADSLNVGGANTTWAGQTVVVSLSVTQNKDNCTVMLADGSTKWIQYVTGVTITPNTAYINYLGKGNS